MDDALEKSSAVAAGQMLQAPEPGDERQPLPAAGTEDAERKATIDWVRQQVADAIPIAGTPAEKYLVIHRRLRGPWPEALRWAPHYRPYPDAPPRHCLLAAATNRAGEIIGLQSTELDLLTGTKAEKVAKPRLSRGPVGEGSVFLGDRLAPAATLVIGEGLETTLTRSLIAPCDAHACLGAVRFIEPAPHHTRVEILADSDKRDAARRLARQYAKDGRAAFVVTVPDSLGANADLNDALCQLGAGATQMAIEDAERFTNEMARRGLSDFDLEIGSDIEIARRIVERLEELYGPIIVAEGRVWRFDHTHWAALDDGHLSRFVHRADGAQYLDANGNVGVVRLNKNRIASILDAAMKYRQEHNFFDEQRCGINCVSGFIRIEADGSPTLQPHARQWRQRHVVRGRWPVSREPEVFSISRLARYLRDSFAGDLDAADKINLLGEVAGCTALGWGTRVRSPKAIVTYSEEGATGKSTLLRLLRSLPNADAVASVPPGKFGDEKYAYRLIGRVLNAADELPDRAVRSDVFKRMITGEPVPARDVYRSAADFAPVALHVFSTNVLPSFSGGVDGGTVRRLLPIEFTHVVPDSERDPDLPERILSEEADLFLDFAVEGACRLVRNRDFTVPASPRELLQRWVLSADPVRAWAAARLEVTGDENTIPVAALFSDFRIWAEGQGLKADFLPNVISFGKRLLCRAGARISPLGRVRLSKCSDLREVKMMAVWSWANVASPVRCSTKARSQLSICPTDPLVGQVDRLLTTLTQPYVGETVSSPSTAALPLTGFDIFASPDNDATPTVLLAPLFRPVPPADSGPSFSEPCIARRGRVEARDGLFLHFCLECGAWGAFGYGVNLRANQLGRWYCAAHRPQGAVYVESRVK